MGLRPGGRFRRVRGCGVDWYAGIRSGGAGAQALSAGEQPRVVWNVLCDHMDVPDPQRWGSDHNAPPMPVR